MLMPNLVVTPAVGWIQDGLKVDADLVFLLAAETFVDAYSLLDAEFFTFLVDADLVSPLALKTCIDARLLS